MNKVYIISKRINYRSQFSDGVILTEKDFNPMRSFWAYHPGIKPESVDYVYVKGMLEDFKYIRCLLKYVFWMLAVGAEVEFELFVRRTGGIGFAIRPQDEIAYEIASVFKDKAILTMCEGDVCQKRIYKKVKAALSDGDSVDKWTFGIVSDGKKNARILNIISRIHSFKIPSYEVLICGPSPSSEKISNVRVINDSSFYGDIRIPICKKKNEIIRQAKFNNIAIIHDRIMFSESWYEQMKINGNYFDALIPAILDEKDCSKHVVDAPHYNYEVFGKHPHPAYKPFWSPTLYIDGSVMIIKKEIAQQNELREYLHWGEKEDVDFAKRLYINGFFISVNHDLIVETQTSERRFGFSSISSISALLHYPFSYPKWLYHYYKEKLLFKEYLTK